MDIVPFKFEAIASPTRYHRYGYAGAVCVHDLIC